MYIAFLMIVPLLIGIISVSIKDRYRRVTILEFLVMEAAVLMVVAVGAFMANYYSVLDTEIISGVVVNKHRDEVSCSHSYSCNCVTTCTGSGKDKSCSEKCDTCYDHPYDVSWVVDTNAMDNSFDVDRIDRQGIEQPPEWTKISLGDPMSFPHLFQNYVKASPDSVLLRRGIKVDPKLTLPEYPSVTNHRATRFLQIGISDPNAYYFNEDLAIINGRLGPIKQVNIMLIEVKSDPTYADFIEQEWLNGKKNDVVVVFGVDQYPKIDWVKVVSWTKNEALKINLRDDLLKLSMDNRNDIIKTISDDVNKFFERRHFKELEYLTDSIQPGWLATVILSVVSIALSIFLTLYFWNNDPFGGNL